MCPVQTVTHVSGRSPLISVFSDPAASRPVARLFGGATPASHERSLLTYWARPKSSPTLYFSVTSVHGQSGSMFAPSLRGEVRSQFAVHFQWQGGTGHEDPAPARELARVPSARIFAATLTIRLEARRRRVGERSGRRRNGAGFGPPRGPLWPARGSR